MDRQTEYQRHGRAPRKVEVSAPETENIVGVSKENQNPHNRREPLLMLFEGTGVHSGSL